MRGAVAATSWHDDTAGFRQVTDISRIIVTFGSAKQLLEAVERVRETFDVAWMENGIQNPTCLGHRDVTFGIRQRVAGSGGLRRQHFSELCLTLDDLDELRRKEGPGFRDKMIQALRQIWESKDEDLTERVLRTTLWALDMTSARGHSLADQVYTLQEDLHVCSLASWAQYKGSKS